MKFIAMIFGAVMNLIYSVFKCRKTRNVISFISRQSETPSMDFRYLINEIKTNYPQYEVVVLCKMIPSGIGGKIRYVSEMFRQMKVMAVSRVVVLDGYCILASMLSHKKDLKIVQIWHALGSASGDACVPNFAEAFGYPENKFIPIGIPRMDYLTSEDENERLRQNIFAKYPEKN